MYTVFRFNKQNEFEKWPHRQYISLNNRTIFEGRKQILPFLRGPQIVFLAILKSILDLEQWTNMNQEFSQ
jgi:hypothetical protein